MVVIASIHQPSTSTLLLFDKVLLLSQGKTVYCGPPMKSTDYFKSNNYPPPPFISPAEFMIELTNTDFVRDGIGKERHLALVPYWESSTEKRLLDETLTLAHSHHVDFTAQNLRRGYQRNVAMQVLILIHRMALV